MMLTQLRRNLSPTRGWSLPMALMPVLATPRAQPEPALLASHCSANWVTLNSMTFPARELVPWARRRRRCPTQDRAFAGSSRLTCRSGRGHWRTETSALPQPCWSPTSHLDRPGNTRRAQEMTGFQRCAPAWELFALAHGESVEIFCSICSSSKMQEKNGRMISRMISRPTNLQPPQSWPAAVASSELQATVFALRPLHDASGDYCAWDETDAICANVRPAYANGNWTARRTPMRTAQAQRM